MAQVHPLLEWFHIFVNSEHTTYTYYNCLGFVKPRNVRGLVAITFRIRFHLLRGLTFVPLLIHVQILLATAAAKFKGGCPVLALLRLYVSRKYFHDSLLQQQSISFDFVRTQNNRQLSMNETPTFSSVASKRHIFIHMISVYLANHCNRRDEHYFVKPHHTDVIKETWQQQ